MTEFEFLFRIEQTADESRFGSALMLFVNYSNCGFWFDSPGLLTHPFIIKNSITSPLHGSVLDKFVRESGKAPAVCIKPQCLSICKLLKSVLQQTHVLGIWAKRKLVIKREKHRKYVLLSEWRVQHDCICT